jgi:hypothetical protein
MSDTKISLSLTLQGFGILAFGAKPRARRNPNDNRSETVYMKALVTAIAQHQLALAISQPALFTPHLRIALPRYRLDPFGIPHHLLHAPEPPSRRRRRRRALCAAIAQHWGPHFGFWWELR